MERIIGNWRITLSVIFSVALVAGTYFFAKSVESPPVAQASAETALLHAIATKDSDGDGLADWEESLYGTDSHTVDSLNLGMTDSEAVSRGLIVPKAIADIKVATSSPNYSEILDPSLPPAPDPGTLTASFAETFFTLYVAAKQNNGGEDLSEEEMQNIASQAVSSLSATIAAVPDFKSAKDITVSGSGADALKEFAVRAEAVLLKNTSNAAASEIAYLQEVVQNGNDDALAPIISIAKAYRESAFGLSALVVPQELARTHLDLVNALMRVSGIISSFARVNADPLATMLALNQYPEAVLALGTAFVHIGEVYKASGISMPPGEPGASFVNLIVDVANEQAAKKKP